jgi:hypothetical protein
MKLESSGQNVFVNHHNIPSESAQSETTVLLSAFQSALSSVLEVSMGETSEFVLEGLIRNLVQLKGIRKMLDDDLQRADVTMEAIEARLLL